MTTYLEKSCSFDLLGVSFVNVGYQSVCVFLCFFCLLVLRWDMGFECINS